MPVIASMSVTQLRAATKEQIVADVTREMTKRELIIELAGMDKIIGVPELTYAKDGQIERQIETIRDIETNEIIAIRQITWTYYEGGEVDEITIIEMDSKGKEISKKIVKHYTDGRQPKDIT